MAKIRPFLDINNIGSTFFQMKGASQQMNKNVGSVSGKSGNSGVNIHIHIQDENDNSPVFVPSKKLLRFS